MRRFMMIFALLMGGPAGLVPAQSTDTPDDDVIRVEVPEVADTGPRPDLAVVAKSIVERTNAFRKTEARDPVAENKELQATAQAFADYMAKTDKYGHTADGTRPAERAKKQGYEYCLVLENIAYAFDSRGFEADKLAETFTKGWQDSPGHRRNMLNRDGTETAVAVARSEKTGHYYAVQLFGRPKSAAIAFEIANQSGETISYRLGDRTFTLAPRYTRTHTQCRAGSLVFEWGPDKTETVTVKAGGRFKVTKSDGNFEVKSD